VEESMRMEPNYTLTRTEQLIMEYFWSSNRGLTIREILDYMREQYGREWKKQTISTYIASLQKAGLIRTDSRWKPYLYYACCTRDAFLHGKTRELIAQQYDNSLGKFIAAFAGEERLSAEEAQELKDLLDRLCPEKDNSERPVTDAEEK